MHGMHVCKSLEFSIAVVPVFKIDWEGKGTDLRKSLDCRHLYTHHDE